MRVALIGAELEENLALRYLWGALEAAGHEVVEIVFNGPGELERAAGCLAASGAPLAGMSLVFTARAREFADLARRARELGYRGHVTTGGHFAAFNAEALLRDVPAIDSVVIGEGEDILCGLAARLDRPAEVRGLVWRAADGAVVRNPPSPKLPDLDTLAWPRRLVPYDDYFGLPIVNVLGSRGCSHHCAFCSISAWHRLCGGARYRMRSPESIADELADLWRRGVRIFNFHDDNFILPNRRLMLERIDRLERALGERGVGRIAFAIKARPDEVDRDLLARLVELGLFRVFLGIEAGSEDALVRLDRGQRLADNVRALEVAAELRLHACFNLLLWNPASTLQDVAANVAFLRSHPGFPMNFCRTEIYSGTPLERQLRETGALCGDYWGYDYRIADPRAQASFLLAFTAFEERCFGETSLHHWAMRLDYEQHLLARFFGCDDDLRERVALFTRTVNLDTCDHLEEILEAVRDGEPGDAFRDAVVARVRARDHELVGCAERLLRELHAAAVRPSVRRPGTLRRRAAAASLAAALTLTGAQVAGATPPRTQPTEMAPPPTRPMPPPQPAPVPLGWPRAIRARLGRAVLPLLASLVRPARNVTVELVLDPGGHVARAEVTSVGLPPGAQQRIVARLRTLVFRGRRVVARRYVVVFGAREIARVARRLRTPVPVPEPPEYTHPREAAPRPPPMIYEMAPKPSGRGEGEPGAG